MLCDILAALIFSQLSPCLSPPVPLGSYELFYFVSDPFAIRERLAAHDPQSSSGSSELSLWGLALDFIPVDRLFLGVGITPPFAFYVALLKIRDV